MTARTVPTVDDAQSPRDDLLQHLQRERKRASLRCADQEMHMLGHDNVTGNIKSIPPSHSFNRDDKLVAGQFGSKQGGWPGLSRSLLRLGFFSLDTIQTLYFGTNPAVSYVCANREEADLLHAIAETGLRGLVSVPKDEVGCAALATQLEERLIAAREKFDDLAAQRAGTNACAIR